MGGERNVVVPVGELEVPKGKPNRQFVKDHWFWDYGSTTWPSNVHNVDPRAIWLFRIASGEITSAPEKVIGC